MNWLSITSRIASKLKPLGKQGGKLISKQTKNSFGHRKRASQTMG